jgi:3-deoxy-D-manno-octulosonate 8-phosphate phosphatase (KDO 8-P phosphatase)
LSPTASKPLANVAQRAKRIQLFLMDVDGTLSRGVCLLSQPSGAALEMKVFHPHDGAGIALAYLAGIRTGVITGRESAALTVRAREMHVEFVYQKQAQKLPAYEEILGRAGVDDRAVAYVGDDLPDLPVMQRVGLAVAVNDAAPEVKRAAHYVTRARGGEGAVREAIELILKAQGRWRELVGRARA